MVVRISYDHPRPCYRYAGAEGRSLPGIQQGVEERTISGVVNGYCLCSPTVHTDRRGNGEIRIDGHTGALPPDLCVSGRVEQRIQWAKWRLASDWCDGKDYA